MRKKVVVTGGAGFIGSHLCERLLDEGNEVVCVDNFFTGTEINTRHLIQNPRFTLLKHDIVQPLHIHADEIYHLACPASPIYYQLDPVKTIKTLIYGTLAVLELAMRLHIKILQASTSEVYGDPLEHPQKETYWGNVNPIGPRACYNEGKRCAETLFFSYHRQHKLKIRVVRIFNAYGPKMRYNDGRVVSNFVVQAVRGEDITIYGTGSQTRSFCFISDIVEGMIRMMDASDDFSGPVNLGNPGEVTILELAQKISGIIGSCSRIRHEVLPEDDPVRRCPDITLAKQKLGWSPVVSLDEGLKKTITFFTKQTELMGSGLGHLT